MNIQLKNNKLTVTFDLEYIKEVMKYRENPLVDDKTLQSILSQLEDNLIANQDCFFFDVVGMAIDSIIEED